MEINMAGQPPATQGMSLSDIQTPALIIDLAALEYNISKLAGIVEAAGKGVTLRPHAKAHKSVAIAQRQISAGAIGVCCQTVGEMEAMVAGGIADVQLSNEIIGHAKATRLARLAQHSKITVCVDDPAQVDDLSEAATRQSVILNILVEIEVGAARCGVLPGSPAVKLARYVTSKPGLRFAGVQAYHGGAQHLRKPAERAAVIAQAVALTRETVLALKQAGLTCDVVTGGGTGTFSNELASGVYTELQCGSYALMDADYLKNESDIIFKNALFVLGTIISTPTSSRAVCDAGLKALSVDSGLPEVYALPNVIYQTASDEHGTLQTNGVDLELGSKVMLVPGHCDPTVNMHDWLVPIRDCEVQTPWPVARAR
jgi:D-serine deaminase-like pyridoxal phosphate-dependent protein